MRVITRVAGIRVGHLTDRAGVTGCTVVLCPPGTNGSVDVKGGAPGTRETDAIRPGTAVNEIHAVLLTGGSAFGLAAASGVQRWLEERGIGFDAGVARVPIVPAAVLFDLAVGEASARPDEAAGYAACEAASDGPVEEGSVGAGTGATFAKLPDPASGWKGGLGSASVEEGELVVSALAAVNALGTVLDEQDAPIAENRNPDAEPRTWQGTNTTLVVVATNAGLSKERAQLLAQAGSEGVSLAVTPAHTMWDGDTVFAIATGEVDAPSATSRPWRRGRSPRRSVAGPRGGSLGGVPGGRGGEMRTLEEAALDASTCTRCRLSQGRTQVVYGVGDPNADLMFIGEAPGFHEDKQGEPFVGAAGQLLNQLLTEIDVPRDDVYINNVILCRPPGNRDPLPDELEACKPWLDERVALIDPAVVVTLGNWATRYILGKQVSISRVRGQRFPWSGRTVIPTFHPAAVLHGGGQASNQMTALRADFQEIRRALAERPQPAEEQLGLF